MAKGQKKSNKETRKPKQAKPSAPVSASPFAKSTGPK
jgi:hypothetical protein